MKKILWLSNFRFTDHNNDGAGSWIETMGRGIIAHGGYEIYNITLGEVDLPVNERVCGVTQWVLPIKACARKALAQLPSKDIIDYIVSTVKAINPDLIHVWGTERFWGLLTARRLVDYPALLEMQGITSAMTPYISGCLTQKEIRKCRGLKEMLRPQLSMSAVQDQFANSAKAEHEMLKGHRFVDYQSEWVKSYIRPWTGSSRLYKTRMILRNEFLESEPWEYTSGNYTVFTTCGWSANKGLHTLVRACGMLKRDFPNLRLRIAGHFQQGIRRSGYTKWVLQEVKKAQISATYLGVLSPDQIVDETQHAAVFVNPSFVESYSMSLAEGMAVGCPCIASYAGAMPEVGGDDCYYFPIGDVGLCSECLRHVFESSQDSIETGKRGRIRSLNLHSVESGILRQCEIYNDILASIES